MAAKQSKLAKVAYATDYDCDDLELLFKIAGLYNAKGRAYVQKLKMKKIMKSLFILISMLIVCSCSSKKHDVKITEDIKVTEEVTESGALLHKITVKDGNQITLIIDGNDIVNFLLTTKHDEKILANIGEWGGSFELKTRLDDKIVANLYEDDISFQLSNSENFQTIGNIKFNNPEFLVQEIEYNQDVLYQSFDEELNIINSQKTKKSSITEHSESE